jgi:Tfp pilus assembly protein PilX
MKNENGFALILSLVLLLAMSLMGGALIVMSAGDHTKNNSSDEYQQTFYVAETALIQGEKYILNQFLGPWDTKTNARDLTKKNLPNNQTTVFNGTMQLINYDGKTAPYTKYNPNTDKSCWNSFTGIDRKTFKVVAAESWNFGKLLYDSSINKGSNPEIKKEKTNLDKYYFEYFITQVGAAPFRGSGVSVKKGANNSGNDGMAYRVYGCGINTGSPTLIVTLESLVILPK